MPLVRVALAARLHARLAADAAVRVDEEFEIVGTGMLAACGSARLSAIAAAPAGSAYAGGPSAFRTRTAHTLYSGIFEIGSCAAIVSWLALLRPGPVIRNEDRVGADRRHDLARSVQSPRRDSSRRPVAVGDAELLGQPRMHLDARLGILVHQRADAPRLRAGQELADDAAGRQDERILGVDVLGRRR